MGNPCNAATGNKYQVEIDARSSDGIPSLTRYYNSQLAHDYGLGFGWTSSFIGKKLVWDINTSTPTTILVLRDTGRGELFTKNAAGVWEGDADTKMTLTMPSGGNYYLTLKDGSVEYYQAGHLASETDRAGRVTKYNNSSPGSMPSSITGPFGHKFTLAYDAKSHVTSVTDPSGQVIRYTYSYTNNSVTLTRVDYPDGTAKVYHYENASFRDHLTGISYVDSLGNVTRYGTYGYNTSGKAILTEHAGGMQHFGLNYTSDTQTIVSDAANTNEVMTFQTTLGVKNLVSNVNQGDGKSLNQVFDAQNNLICKRDDEGRVTTYTYNATNQRTGMSEGLTGDCVSPQTTGATRTTNYQYVATSRDLPTVISSPSVAAGQVKTTTIAYGDTAHPNLPTSIIQSGYNPSGSSVSRTVTLAYNSFGQVNRIDGPRTDANDITTLTYNTCTTGAGCGQLASIANAVGQVTSFNTYDASGRLTQSTDPNGLRTNYVYDPRGQVVTIAQTPPIGSARVTQYTYTAAGDVASVTFPDGRTLSYTYDAARLLRQVTDNLGNQIRYGYDLKGNRTQEYTYDPANTLVRQMDLAYDARNRLAQINTAGSLTQQIHDAVGNLVQQVGPNNNPPATNSYDALNRLIQTLNSLGGTTAYAYDPNDKPIQVQAPNNATTQYVYDDLGNLLQEISPDQGTTSYAYDGAGNVLSKTDARGVAATYHYDALNRLVSIGYPSAGENVTYTYDTGTNCTLGRGRLCQVMDASGTTQYGYDAFGNVTTEVHTELNVAYTTRYGYDAGDRIASITYPNQRIVSYARDAVGRIASVTSSVGAQSTTLIGNRTYRPDSLLATQTFGNGLNEVRQYDLQGRLTNQFVGSADTRLYSYDPNRNLTSEQSLPQVGAYTYDALDRLINDNITSSPASAIAFSYDGNGNRLSDGAGSYSYVGASNRLAQAAGNAITTDAAGNITDNGMQGYSYNDAGHLQSVSQGAATLGSYVYNHQRQRTRKSTSVGTTVYHYDLQGRLIAETTTDGYLVRDYVYADDAPIAQIDAGETIFYLHSDHEGTPRLATDAAQSLVWRWEGRAFGDTAPTGSVTVNLRFAGQYADSESGLYYNWNRYYDPKLGRHTQPDLVSVGEHVEGELVRMWGTELLRQYGINLAPASNRPPLELNPYLYTAANPLRWIDPDGLSSLVFDRGDGSLSAFDRNGNFLFFCPAANNTTRSSSGPWPNGHYPYSHYNRHPESGSTGGFGSHGIFVFRVPGREGMGVHSGQRGPSSPTLGCIRTDDPCMQRLTDLHANDPITDISVQ